MVFQLGTSRITKIYLGSSEVYPRLWTPALMTGTTRRMTQQIKCTSARTRADLGMV